MTDEQEALWRRRRQDLLIGVVVACGITLVVTLHVGLIHGVWNVYTEVAVTVFLALVAAGLFLRVRDWWRRPTYRRPRGSKINLDLNPSFKTLASIVAALALIGFLTWRESRYWPHVWPLGPTSSWNLWDWAYVGASVALVFLAILARFQRWSSRIDLWENTQMRQKASKLKLGERDDGGSAG